MEKSTEEKSTEHIKEQEFNLSVDFQEVLIFLLPLIGIIIGLATRAVEEKTNSKHVLTALALSALTGLLAFVSAPK